MITRRRLLTVLGVAPFTPSVVFAQAKQQVQIGWLSFSSRESGARTLASFKEGLAALGWKEGAQIVIEERWADGYDDRLTPFAHELAGKKAAR